MLTVIDSNEQFDDPTDYAPSIAEGKSRATYRQLQRMYPTVIIMHDSSLLDLILNRTLAHMMHMDTVFSLNTTWEASHFAVMESEAMILSEWLDTPDGTPFPKALKYVSPVNTLDNGEVTTGEAVTESPKVRNVTPRAVSKNSAYQKAFIIFQQDQANNVPRAATLSRMIDELSMNGTTANVYYSKFKNPAPVTQETEE